MRRVIAFLCVSFLFHSCQKESAVPVKGNDPQIIKLKVTVKLLVGQFLYENIEASIMVKGFDADNIERWNDTIPFSGPTDNVLSVQSGFHHYTIAIEKWGVSDSQTLTMQQLFDSRVDGPTPVTYGLGGKVPVVKKPALTYEYTGGDNNIFTTQSRTEYQYNPVGDIERMTLYEDYSSEATSQIPTRYFVFTYISANVLYDLSEYNAADVKLSSYKYEHGIDGKLLKITNTNYLNPGATGEMDLTYDSTFKLGNASYHFSNGAGFDYAFEYSFKNIVSEKITVGSELCSKGTFTFDKNINPFKHLGYVNFLMDDYSINNKLTESVDYLACAFPSLNPESYTYEYDDLGYPTKRTIHYKSLSKVTATKYFYKSFKQ